VPSNERRRLRRRRPAISPAVAVACPEPETPTIPPRRRCAAPPVRAGVVRGHSLGERATLDYFLYVPTQIRVGAPPLVTVHGISRNALEHARAFAPFAEAEGWVIVAPLFDPKRYGDYQRLGRSGRGERADRALGSLLSVLAREFPMLGDSTLLFGFSGGAQFVHRYLMAYPESVAAAVSASAGWYTFPDPTTPYPYGIRVARELPGLRFERTRFSEVPTLVLVGGEDRLRDASLRQGRSLDRHQGPDRVERARRWCRAMERLSRAAGRAPCVELEVVPGIGHSFEEGSDAGLLRRAVQFLKAGAARAERGRGVPGKVEVARS